MDGPDSLTLLDVALRGAAIALFFVVAVATRAAAGRRYGWVLPYRRRGRSLRRLVGARPLRPRIALVCVGAGTLRRQHRGEEIVMSVPYMGAAPSASIAQRGVQNVPSEFDVVSGGSL